jgi:ferredoxin-NADP reductase
MTATEEERDPEPPTAASLRPRLVWREAEVLEVIAETPRTRSLVLRVSEWPGHLPGQHVDLRLTAEDGYQAQRSYSIASPPERPEMVLTVERIDEGEVSPFLTEETRPGDRLELRGPVGGYFTWTASLPGPLQLVAGGSGIVPLMAMLRHRAHARTRTAAHLLFSSRALESIIYRRELEEMMRDDPQLQVVHTLTRAAPPDWSGPHGRVDREMLRAVAFSPEQEPRVYVCGPTPFVEYVADALVSLGHSAERIKTERFGPTGGQP